MKLDLGKFKKVKSDKESTVLRHPDGHEIRVAHKALSPKMREQMHSLPMADGGPVPESSGRPDKGPSIGSQKDRAAVEKGATESGTMDAGKAWQNIKQGLGFAEGGEAEPYGNAVPENAAEEKIDVKDGGTSLPARSSGMRSGPPKGGIYGGGGFKEGQARKAPGDEEPLAKGGAVKKMADGGNVSETEQDSPEKIASDAAASQPQQTQQPQAPVVINVGGAAAPQQQAPQQQPAMFSPEYDAKVHQDLLAAQRNSQQRGNMVVDKIKDFITKPVGLQPGQQSALGVAIPGQAPQAPQAPQDSSAPIGAPANMPQAPQPNPMDQYGDMLSKGIHEQEAGIMQGADAAGELGRMQAGQLQNSIAQQQQMMQDYQQHYSALDKERKAFQQDIQDQHIDPQHYMNSMGTGQKIRTAIGMIIAGAGSGVLHQDNPVIKYINQQIQNDIDAQKAELGKKENLLSANMKQFGNLHDATLMTQVMQKDIVANQLEQAIAKMADPIAKSKALQQLGALHTQSAMLTSQIAASRTMAGAGNNVDQYLNMMRVANPERAKELESRYVPGVGIASVPLSEDARKQAIAMQDFHNQMSNLIQWANKHSGESKLTNPTDVNEGRAMAQAAQNSYRTAQSMGVYKQSEAPLLEGEIPADPTAFFNKFRVLPQYKAVLDNNARKMHTFGKAYGLNNFGANAAPSVDSQGYQPKSFRPIGK